MRMLMKTVLVLSGLLLVGCGGGGAPQDLAQNQQDNTLVYQNKTMPVISENTVPEVFSNSAEVSNSIGNKSFKLSKTNEVESYGFRELQKNMRFFYSMQLEMNMNLSYYDSIWNQIETYCGDSTTCEILDSKIVFTYTKALYNHDLELIELYQKKTSDYDSYADFIVNGKELIGTKIPLSSASLVRDQNTGYDYVLTSDILSMDEESPTVGTSTLKWNTDHSKYLLRDNYHVTGGDDIYVQFKYSDNIEQKESEFSTNNYYTSGTNAILRFIEKDKKIEFLENIDFGDGIVSYAEGYLDDNGGRMVSFTEPEGVDERFDSEGNILTEIKCSDMIHLDTDYTNLANDISCDIGDPVILKDIITKNVYSLGSAIFEDDATFTPTSVPSSKTMVKFEDNNTLFAIIDCSTFTADYNISNTGIKFSNIVRTISPELQCLYPKNEDKFEDFLKNGYNQGYSTTFDFLPLFDNVGSAADFNKTKFIEQLHADTFVDSPLMNSVFKIQSVTDYTNVKSGKYMVLLSDTQVKVENNKIIIDLLDAKFDADIEVVDPTHIKFVNVNRVNKTDVTYPEDVNLSCPEENLDTPDECMEDPYTDSTNSDKIFADIVERFLNETVEVTGATTDYTFINFIGSEISFTGSILAPEPVKTPFKLTIGDIVTSQIYTPEDLPIIISDQMHEITTVAINKDGAITLEGEDASLFTVNEGVLSFAVEVNASSPVDVNENGIYKLTIGAVSNEGDTILYKLSYKIPIPGTQIVKDIADMAGVWDFSEEKNRKHYEEIMVDGKVRLYDYNDAQQCFDTLMSATAIRKSSKEGIFEDYVISDNMINLTYTAEIRNTKLYRTTYDGTYTELTPIPKIAESASELAAQVCQ